MELCEHDYPEERQEHNYWSQIPEQQLADIEQGDSKGKQHKVEFGQQSPTVIPAAGLEIQEPEQHVAG